MKPEKRTRSLIKKTLLATCLTGILTTPMAAQTQSVDRLLEQLDKVRKKATEVEKVVEAQATPGAYTRLPMLNRSNFLRGSDDAHNWTLHMTEEDVQEGGEFVVGYRNSATVLPDASSIELYVNGEKVSTSQANGASALQTIRATLTGKNVLKPGANVFSIRAKQMHRVDCTYQASRELWTQIIPDASGFRYANKNRRISNISDFHALPVSDGQVERINFVMKEWSAERASRYLNVIQSLVTQFDMNNPVIGRFQANSTSQDQAAELDIFAGTSSELENNKDLQTLYKDVDFKTILSTRSNEPILVSSKTQNRHLLIYLTEHVSEASFQQALGESMAKVQSEPFDITGLEEQSITLDQAGIDMFERNRVAEYSVKLLFPPDFYPADYNNLSLSLEGKADLGDREQLDTLVYVNGNVQSTVTILPSDIENGIWQKNYNQLPLTSFKPGLNQIRFTTELAQADSNVCNANPDQKDTIFEMNGASKLHIPVLAHLASGPDIMTTFSTGKLIPDEESDQELMIASEEGDFKSLSTAATMLAQLSSQTGKVIRVRHYAETEAPSNTKSSLIVTSNPRSKILNETKWHTINETTLNQLWLKPEDKNKPVNPFTTPDGFKPLSPDAPNDRVETIQSDNNLPVHEFGEALKDFFGMVISSEVFAQEVGEDSSTTLDNAEFIISQNNQDGVLKTVILHSEDATKTNLGLIARDGMDETTSQNMSREDMLWQTAKIYLDMPSLPSPSLDMLETERLTEMAYLKNLRLLVAGYLSNNPILYGFSFLIALFLSGFFYQRIMNYTARHEGEEYDRYV